MRILAVTSVKDEGPFLLEWIAWHRLIGVTGFLIHSNDCSDGTDRLLDLLAAEGVVTHLPHRPDPAKSVQWQALAAAWRHPLAAGADWVLVSDVDEFPVIHAGAHRLADLFAALPEATEAVALPWRLFGAAGIAGFADRPVTAQFQRSAPPGLFHPIAATQFKSLFRPAGFDGPGVHRPAQRPGTAPRWADGSGLPLPEAVAANDRRLSLLPQQDRRALAEMHHYSLRSAQSFVVKSARGLPNRRGKALDLTYWVERNFNTVANPAALALQDPLAEGIAALKALPGVAEAHEAACAAHLAAFARLVRTAAGHRLFAQCLHAADSAALPDALALHLLRLYQEIEDQRPPPR